MGLFDFIKRESESLFPSDIVPAITAAGTRHKAKELRSIHTFQSASARERQDAAWMFYHTLPEIAAPADYQGKAFARLKWVIGKRDDKGDVSPIGKPTTKLEKDLNFFLNSIATERGGDFSDLAAAWATQQWVCGESYLVSYKKKGKTFWDMVSYSDIEKTLSDGNPITRVYPDSTSTISLRPHDLVIRLYTPDAQWKNVPYSTVFPVLELLEDLRVVQAAQALSDRSRASAAGILFVPQTWDLPSVPSASGKQLLLVERIIEAAEQAISDPTNPGASVPIVVEVPTTNGAITEPIHIRFESPDDEMLSIKYDKLIKRIAIGVGAPQEMVTGERGNHWATWASSDEGFSLHIAPAAEQFCGDLTRLLLWKAMESLGHSPEEVQKYFLTFDPSKFITRPNNSEYWRYGHSVLAISDAAFRRRIGATEDDAPSEQEIVDRLAKDGMAYPSDRARERPRMTPDRVKEGTPKAPTHIQQSALKAAAAADTWLLRARERAGSRIRSKVTADSEVGRAIEKVGNADVWAQVNRGLIESYDVTMTYLLSDATSGLKSALETYTTPEVAARLVPYIEELYHQYFFDPAPDIFNKVRTRTEVLLSTQVD